MGYILFSSEEELSICWDRYWKEYGVLRAWDGIIEYSYDNKQWQEWLGDEIINNKIYMRGVNNTIVSGGMAWIINGKNIKCQGNIENLLDYKFVINNVHPQMKDFCFGHMFYNCVDLVECPQLLAMELTDYCYTSMFEGCKKITILPQLSATKLAWGCYSDMFGRCTSIKTVSLSELPLAPKCYEGMFSNCINLHIVPTFSNFQIAKEAIINQHMFDNCPIQQVNINNKLYDINVLKLL